VWTGATKMTFKWVALAKLHRKVGGHCGRPAKDGYWKISREPEGYVATNTRTGATIKTVCEGKVFWLTKTTAGDCPNYVALELKDMNEKLGLTFYLDKVRLKDGRDDEKQL
jgi:hypothetical protein